MQKLSNNFTLEELTWSDTANKYHINNTPSEEIINKLKNLATEVLQPIRDVYNKPIKISSGYRCPELNKKIGGVRNSQHVLGEAADLVVGSIKDNLELFNLIKKMVQENKITVGQLINECKGKWIHVSLPRIDKPNNQILYL